MLNSSSSTTVGSAQRWDEAHATHASSDNSSTAAKTATATATPSRLYTDENPATTIKGTGFKNERIARRTIELTSQPGARYKQYWTIRAMRERAAHHPRATDGMRDAMAVFDGWLSDYEEPTEEERKERREEWETFRKLSQSHANQNSYGKDPSKEELTRARKDMAEGRRLLFELLKTCRPNRESSSIAFPLVCFVGLFGGPGLHGYGKHTIDAARCTSRVDVIGIEELIGSPKTLKLALISSSEIRVYYHRKEESASAHYSTKWHK